MSGPFFPWLVVLLALAALGGSFTLVPLIGTEFLPSLDEGSIADMLDPAPC